MAKAKDRDNLNPTGRRSASAANQGDWTVDEGWWRENWSSRPYVREDRGFDYYSPAFRYGTEAADRFRGKDWNAAQRDLERGWEEMKGESNSRWEDVKDAVRDAWDRATNRDRDIDRGDIDRTSRTNF